MSFTQRAVAGIRYEVEAARRGRCGVVVQSELVANERGRARADEDPRAAAALGAPLVAEERTSTTTCAWCSCTTTRAQRAALAAAMDHGSTARDGDRADPRPSPTSAA